MAMNNDKPVDEQNPLPVKTLAAAPVFREAFESFVPGPESNWNLVQTGAGDLVQVDGNAVSASYLVISKDPFTADTETIVESMSTFGMPFRLSIGASLSQRASGQEFFLEAVSTDPGITPSADRTATSIQQTTTTLSVTTAAAHNFMPGSRISVYGVSDSRLNYSQLVVATVPTPTTFTATAGPMGTIPSVTAGPFTGFISGRSSIGGARDGTSMDFEGTSNTAASFYVRSNSGDALPSGTLNGNQTVTTGSSTSVQLLNSVAAYAFAPTVQVELQVQSDAVSWSDIGLDSSTGTATVRSKRTQVVPDPTKDYKLRIRGVNRPSFSEPVATIVSSAKSGTTTATVVTATPHGLTTGDQVVIYGSRDQVAFVNLSTATAVASVVNATTFTIVYGTAVTQTTYGGYVGKVNGGQAVPGLVGQTVTTLGRLNNLVTIVGSASWTGLVIGDYVNLIGATNDTNGTSLGVDGSYRVRDIATTTLVLEPIGTAPTGGTISVANANGAIVKRSDLRVYFVRASVESSGNIARQDTSASAPVLVTNSTLLVQGQVGDNSATIPNAVLGGVKAQSANPTAATTGRMMSFLGTLIGALVIKPFSIPELDWTAAAGAGGKTDLTDQVLKTAAAAGIRNYLTCLQYQNTSAVASEIVIKDGAAIIWRGMAPASMAMPAAINFDTPLRSTAATALNAAMLTTGTATYINAQGYTAP